MLIDTQNSLGRPTNSTTTGGTAQSQPPLKQSPPPLSPPEEQPPAYGAQANTYPVQPYPAVGPYSGSQPLLRPPPPPGPPGPGSNPIRVHHEPTWWRFLKALGAAILIYFLFSLLVESIVMAARWNRRHIGTEWNYVIPRDIRLQDCSTDWQSVWKSYGAEDEMVPLVPNHMSASESAAFTSSSKLSFNVSLDSAALLLISRGPLSSGQVTVVTGKQDPSTAVVEVVARYSELAMRDLAKVCLVRRLDGSKGVGIFTPEYRNRPRQEQLYFQTKITLPESALINKLETDVPNTSHRVPATDDVIRFMELVLTGSNAPISIDRIVSVNRGIIQTTNGGITGNFESASHLKILTTNGAVDVNAQMHFDNTEPKLDIVTTNGNLRASILLDQVARSASATPHYGIDTHTTNGKLDVSIKEAPLDSVIQLKAQTSNDKAVVSLHPTYVGNYLVQTTNANAEVTCGSDELQSFSTQCRHRQVRPKIVKKNMQGGWINLDGGDESPGPLASSVSLVTTNGRATLRL